jgi:hypothetical protein
MASVIAGAGTHRKLLEQTMATTDGIVRIASAYVTDTGLISVRGTREVRLLTALSTIDIVCGATSLDSLATLTDSGVSCRFLSPNPKLHAKVYIFDEHSAVVTSANLTRRALDSNIEVGVQITGREAGELACWFDRLWNSAEPLYAAQLLNLRQKTAALRREFAFLRARCEIADLPGTLPDISDERQSSSFEFPVTYFMCNTDRIHGGKEREELMRLTHYVAAWEDFSHTKHMRAVKRGDIIFMYANRIGVIGMGKAVAGCAILEPGEAGRLSDEESGREWRIPVDWLRWVEESHACPWENPPPPTFTDVSADHWRGRRDRAFRHFLGDSAVVQVLGL